MNIAVNKIGLYVLKARDNMFSDGLGLPLLPTDGADKANTPLATQTMSVMTLITSCTC